MMNNDKNEEMARKMLSASLRVSLFGLQSMVSFMRPFMPTLSEVGEEKPATTKRRETLQEMYDKLP